MLDVWAKSLDLDLQMGDFWRTADRSINNQNLDVSNPPDGIDDLLSYVV